MSTTASELPIVVATPVDSTSLLYQSKKNEKVILQWKDLNYSILQKDAKKSSFLKPHIFDKKILKNISGEAQSGQLLAIMGPTGCGKVSIFITIVAHIFKHLSFGHLYLGVSFGKVNNDINLITFLLSSL